MKKDEILERSRVSKSDEGMDFARDQGRKIGLVCFHVLLIVMLITSRFVAKVIDKTALYALLTLAAAFWASESYAMYRFSRETSYLALALLTAVLSLVALALFFVFTFHPAFYFPFLR